MWMRTTPLLLAAAFAALLTACAAGGGPGTPEPAATDFAGAYTLTTSFQGAPVHGRMQIRGEPGAYDGSLYTDLTGQMSMRSIETDGKTMEFTADTPDGPIHITLTFNGDTFTGRWSLRADSGSIRGQRVGR